MEARVSALERDVVNIKDAIASSLNALPEMPSSPDNANVFSVGPARPGLQ